MLLVQPNGEVSEPGVFVYTVPIGLEAWAIRMSHVLEPNAAA